MLHTALVARRRVLFHRPAAVAVCPPVHGAHDCTGGGDKGRPWAAGTPAVKVGLWRAGARTSGRASTEAAQRAARGRLAVRRVDGELRGRHALLAQPRQDEPDKHWGGTRRRGQQRAGARAHRNAGDCQRAHRVERCGPPSPQTPSQDARRTLGTRPCATGAAGTTSALHTASLSCGCERHWEWQSDTHRNARRQDLSGARALVNLVRRDLSHTRNAREAHLSPSRPTCPCRAPRARRRKLPRRAKLRSARGSPHPRVPPVGCTSRTT
eukprot:4593937-Prymnesium_polylepis.1